MKYPLIALPLSTLLILTGCGGSSSGGDSTTTPPPPPAVVPTVTVTAPANAIANVAFQVAWTSTNAASCSSAFASGTATSGSKSITVTTTGDKTYQVTCTSSDGHTASGSATVAVVPQATAEGLWQGTGTGNGGDRAVRGVITKENGYWLTYSAANTPTQTVGFFAGDGTSTPNADGVSGTFPSSNLREFDFGAGTAGGGALTLGAFNKAGSDKSAFAFTGTTTSTDLTASWTFGGTQAYDIDEVTGPGSSLGGVLTQTPAAPAFTDGGSAWSIVPNANNLAGTPGISGSFNFEAYQVSVDLSTGFNAIVNLSVPNRILTFSTAANNGTVTWTPHNSDPNNPQGGVLEVNNIVFTETSPGVTCNTVTNPPGGPDFCTSVPGPSTVTHGKITITFAADMLTYTGVAVAHQNVDMLAQDATGICYMDGGANPCANNTLTFSGTVPNAASVTQQLATTYNAAYETAPALADVAGSYAGSDGVAGAIHASATFGVDAQGQVTGLAEGGQCAVSGTVSTHSSGGNVYDVALTFANGTGTCDYSGAFNGVATYDATNGAITVTAVNATRDQGFLFTGAKAQ